MAARETWVESNISPYRLAGVLSEVVEETIQPQRMYAAAKSGSLSTSKNDLGHLYVTPKNANEFIESFLQRREEKAAKAEAEAAAEVEA